MASLAVDRFGRIDVLVNNAAVSLSVAMTHASFDRLDVAEWDRMPDVNPRGSWFAACAVFPTMRERPYGKIVNISSGIALTGNPDRVHYVGAAADGRAIERTGTPEGLEGAVVFFSSSCSGFITARPWLSTADCSCTDPGRSPGVPARITRPTSFSLQRSI
jgi:short subunit dehydrogenase